MSAISVAANTLLSSSAGAIYQRAFIGSGILFDSSWRPCIALHLWPRTTPVSTLSSVGRTTLVGGEGRGEDAIGIWNF